MAKKRAGKGVEVGNGKTEEAIVSPAVDAKIEEFAEDLGRLLGSAKAKADSWIGQRHAIAEHLTNIRDTAAGLLSQLGSGTTGTPAVVKRGPGRPAMDASAPKKRTMSPEAREKIAAAQRARWAKQKRAAKG